MKKHIIILIISTLFSCSNNTDKAMEWINTHPKPIIVIKKSINGITMGYRYTFIDSSGIVVYYDEVQALLPDTIFIK